jgi:hypothetical protein
MVMAAFAHVRFPDDWDDWIAHHEDNDAAVLNLLDHPTARTASRSGSRLVCAGDGLFSGEKEIYNPNRDAPRVIGARTQAGGQLAARVIRQPNT